MIWAHFEEPFSHLCLTGAVVAFLSLTQETTGSSPFNDKYFFGAEIAKFSKKIQYCNSLEREYLALLC